MSELDRLTLYFRHKQIGYYSNEDEEEISFRRYISFGKKTLNSNMLDKGVIKEDKLLDLDLIDIVLFMNYIFTYVEFSDSIKSEILNRIQKEISQNFRFSVWKEYYRWINLFIYDKEISLKKAYDEIERKIYEHSSNKYVDIRVNQIDYINRKFIDTYVKINDISYILGDAETSKSNELYSKLQKSGMQVRKTPIRYFIENINSRIMFDNSYEFYNNQYTNSVPFIALWEVLLYDQLVNLLFKKNKSIEQSIETFKMLNKIESFKHIYKSNRSQIKGINVHEYDIVNVKDTSCKNNFIVSHPNLCLDKIDGEPLDSWSKPPSFSDSANLLKNVIESHYNKTDLLVLPELYVHYHWLHFLGYTSQLFQMNISMGLRNLVVKGRYYNFILSFYTFKDIYLRRNLFVTAREKNFYAYDELDWCSNNHCKIKNTRVPKYIAVRNKGITFADYVCYEVTDIFSRAVFKGKVDIIVIPMLNKDTSYFDSIIHSLSRDLSCIIVTSNSASWGNSSIILPKSTAARVLTEFKGGFNQYLVSSEVPVYELIEYNKKFITRDKKSIYKPHSANFEYLNKDESFKF